MSHDSETTFNVKRSRSTGRFTQHSVYTHQQAAAVVHVGTYWQWGPIGLVLRCRLQARRREALWRPQREERGAGISWRPPAYSLLVLPAPRSVFYCFYLCLFQTVNRITQKLINQGMVGRNPRANVDQIFVVIRMWIWIQNFFKGNLLLRYGQ